MVKIDVSIKDDDKLFESIKFSCMKYIQSNDTIYLNTKSHYKYKDKKTVIYDQLKDNVLYTLKYNDLVMEIIINEIGLPLALETQTVIHNIMNITIDNEKSKDENMDILNKFYDEVLTYYRENILDKKKVKGKTTIYIWDDYWETIEKRTSRNIDTIYLDGKEKQVLAKLNDFLSEETEQQYTSLGIPYKYNILLHGYPGTGKTSLIYSLASELGMNIALLHFTKNLSDTDFLRALRKLPENTMLVFEDITDLFQARKKNDEINNSISFSGLLNSLDGIGHIDKLIVCMTTNCYMVLDKALVRPGRVDLNIGFKYSNKRQIKTMFEKFLPKQKDKFTEFYKQIKNLKITTAVLQQYLFGHIKDENILDYIEELEKLANENDYDKNKEVLYT
jgi:SpoVK/Ycf46/Vps4 family AAA+-type ATPase